MKRLITMATLCMAAALLLFAAFHHTQAQGRSSHTANATSGPPHALPLTSDVPGNLMNLKHILDKTIFSQSFPDVGISGDTWYSLEPSPISFYCWRPCTLELTQNVTLGEGTATGNGVEIDPYVDGQLPGNYGASGEVPADGSWVIIVLDQTVSLGPGTHTVQAFIETYDAATFWGYTDSYKIYYP